MRISTPCLLGSLLALLAAPVRADRPSVVLTPSFVSQYMFRGVRYGGASLQPAVEVDSGNLAIGVWSSFPMADRGPGQADSEIDPYGSYTITVSESVSIVPGFSWYTYPDADAGDGTFKSTVEPSIALNCTVAGAVLTPKLSYDLMLKGPTYEFTAAYTVPLKEISSELDFTATAGTFIIRNAAKGADPRVKNWGDYFLVGVTMPFTITKQSKLTIGIAYTKGSGNFFKAGSTPKVANPGAVGRGVASISYAWTF